MSFEFPGAEPELSPAVVQLIEQSAARFAARFAAYRMFLGEQIPGWVREYREELEKVARAASGEAKRESPAE